MSNEPYFFITETVGKYLNKLPSVLSKSKPAQSPFHGKARFDERYCSSHGLAPYDGILSGKFPG